MDFDDVAIVEGEFRHGNEGAVAHDQHVPARQLEEALDIGDEFAVLRLPSHGSRPFRPNWPLRPMAMTARTSGMMESPKVRHSQS